MIHDVGIAQDSDVGVQEAHFFAAKRRIVAGHRRLSDKTVSVIHIMIRDESGSKPLALMPSSIGGWCEAPAPIMGKRCVRMKVNQQVRGIAGDQSRHRPWNKSCPC